jgi:hypothetical protein
VTCPPPSGPSAPPVVGWLLSSVRLCVSSGGCRLCCRWRNGSPGERRAQAHEENDKNAKLCSTRPSRVVPHRSATRARRGLTSLFGIKNCNFYVLLYICTSEH